MTLPKRFVIHPGFVWSRSDGDRHYISSSKLAALHHIGPALYYVCSACSTGRGDCFTPSDMVALFPRYDGKYKRLT